MQSHSKEQQFEGQHGHKKDKHAEASRQFRPRFNYRSLCEALKEHRSNMKNRGLDPGPLDQLPEAYEQYRHAQARVNDLRSTRNALSKRIPGLRAQSQKEDEGDVVLMELERVLDEAAELKGRIEEGEEELEGAEADLRSLASLIPNTTHPEAPIGEEEAARVVGQKGEAPITFPFTPKDHVALGELHKLIDLEAGALVSGARFCYLRGDAALLEMALVQYTLGQIVSQGFLPISAPDLVKSELVEACGFRPRDPGSSQIYQVAPEATDLSEGPMALAGTAEIPLAGMLAQRILQASELPGRYVAFGRCFRAEAGARGRDTRGIYRLHQFSKVEMFAVSTPGQSDMVLEELRYIQEGLFQSLGLSYRVLDMPTEELGASAYRKYDVEAWMPGRGDWGEISSASNCTDYQARRLNIRYRERARAAPEFVHTLNGTGCAVPRMLVAILETYQEADGRIRIPEVLRPYMLGKEYIG
ncbi:seryl-tRNA synthetase [Piptocephalis cylindrospora]|uniref:serine--tRNA ligase n=1 Tax=Piptocephalis cylindrospora TaxID=1907219 RepID=A0A4P9Y8F8_9FUNG|nr:seryl-tRNA synthetase [Piptocephalis cylindrospora]|eukprot:RKP15074.1 seryl-tRNA synthetase [Piptocephalis cylindrospora]